MEPTANGIGGVATVFGGSGFLGRHIVRALARRGWRVRAAVRRPNLAGFLQPDGGVGQVQAVQANLRYPESIAAALRGADVAVNAAGIARQSGRQNFEAVHVFGAEEVARAAARLSVARLIHVSGIGADAQSHSPYIASKGKGEAAAAAAFPATTIVRPSVVFGPEDDFLNRFAALACVLPVLPLFGGGDTRLQPVFVGDVALAAANAVANDSTAGKIYELGGTEVFTLREIVEFVLATIGRRRILAPLPFPVARLLALGTEIASAATFGKFPAMLTTTRDQIELLRRANVVSPAAIAEKRDLAGLGVAARGLEALAPVFLSRFRKSGQYATNDA